MLYTCVKTKANFSTCLSVILTNCQTSGDEKVAVYFLKKRDLCEYLTILHFSFIQEMFLSFFFLPLLKQTISLGLVYSISRISLHFFSILPTTCNVLPYICSTQRLMLPLISNIYIFQTLMPPLISSLIDKFAGAASSVLVMLEMNSNHAIPDAAL